MKIMAYSITIKGVMATAQAVGYDGATILHERDVWEFVKETSQIARSEGVDIHWIIQEE